jgi:hypothetical protein
MGGPPALGHNYVDGVCTRCGAVDPNYLPFVDVTSGDWYFSAVVWAFRHDPQITAGTSATTFSPDQKCTRAQIVTFLWRAADSPEPTITESPFNDVQNPNAYYYKAVLWAYENGITTGVGSATFGVKQACTRAQIVTFLWRYEDRPEPESAGNPFTDVQSDRYYCNAVLWAVERGITQCADADRFCPESTSTRAQIVTFLYRSKQ